ncbi:DUF4283 domain-containing protein [Raphanus sativus]|nr:DUF4283 domain-containing protein [Raphanus sativus]
MSDGDGENPTKESDKNPATSTSDPPIPPSSPSSPSPPTQIVAPWSINRALDAQPEVEIVEGVASIQIPDDIFDEAELLWKSFVVGYFIGDAPHVGSIHATVNCIWSSPKAGTKIDVQFIEKNTVLFRIDNSQMRTRVINRKYWHISDVPLVMNEWTPESALNPPDLTAMPLWVDLKGVPNGLFSHKGLKCLTRAVGKFVKLHPHTERCTRLDVARVLAEIDLHQPLMEKIVFTDREGVQREIGVNFPWLPPRCNICKGWGHKGTECKDTNTRILKRPTVEVEEAGFGQVPVADDITRTARSSAGGMLDLLKELEALLHGSTSQVLPVGNTITKDTENKEGVEQEEMLRITLTDPTTEVFPAAEVEGWEKVQGSSGNIRDHEKQVDNSVMDKQLSVEAAGVVSPSRFSPLMGIEEDEEEVEGNGELDVEEGEITGAAGSQGKETQGAQTTRKLVSSSNQKSTKQRVVRTKDLKFAGRQGISKKTSGRKL